MTARNPCLTSVAGVSRPPTSGAPHDAPGHRLACASSPTRARALADRSAQGARRNAMLACTDLAARRAEREDVEDFLRGLDGAPLAVHA